MDYNYNDGNDWSLTPDQIQEIKALYERFRREALKAPHNVDFMVRPDPYKQASMANPNDYARRETLKAAAAKGWPLTMAGLKDLLRY